MILSNLFLITKIYQLRLKEISDINWIFNNQNYNKKNWYYKYNYYINEIFIDNNINSIWIKKHLKIYWWSKKYKPIYALFKGFNISSGLK